jgi:hypothetical membrane protein
MTAWDLTLLAVHIFAAYGAAMLYCTAPDWMQKLVLANLIAAELVLVGVFAYDAAGQPLHWMVKLLAYKVEHIGVLLYIFRLLFVERVSCRRSSQHYQHSQA